jgi:hypothetical protein
MDIQLNELRKGDKARSNPNRYNLRSKSKEGNPGVPDQPTRKERLAKFVEDSNPPTNSQISCLGGEINSKYPLLFQL